MVIYQAKPNPIGKDRTPMGSAKPEQLLGEWVDIKNIGSSSILISTIHLFHTQFRDSCQPSGVDEYWNGGGNEFLRPGQVLRIHTGRQSDQHLMASADKVGADGHRYANRNSFALNNRCGDALVIRWQDDQGRWWQDEARYAPNPPEGAVLRREGNQLLAGFVVRH